MYASIVFKQIFCSGYDKANLKKIYLNLAVSKLLHVSKNGRTFSFKLSTSRRNRIKAESLMFKELLKVFYSLVYIDTNICIVLLQKQLQQMSPKTSLVLMVVYRSKCR